MPSTGKLRQIGAKVCQEHVRQTPCAGGKRLPALERGFLGGAPLGKVRTPTLAFLIQGSTVGQVLAAQDLVVRRERPLQGVSEPIVLGSHLPTGPWGHHGRIRSRSGLIVRTVRCSWCCGPCASEGMAQTTRFSGGHPCRHRAPPPWSSLFSQENEKTSPASEGTSGRGHQVPLFLRGGAPWRMGHWWRTQQPRAF